MQAVEGYSQTAGIEGMLSGWSTLSYSESLNGQLGGRYIPGLTFDLPLGKRFRLDAEVSANVWGSSTFWSGDSTILNGKLKPYRMWLRFSGDQFEIRAGLQKINFGSATLLRPLMWFDRIDPRDPLQLTDGTYGILARYYFLNNTNIWIWGLIGNKEPKGWEAFGSEKNRPEFGGRIQVPVFTGELGLSYHNRSTDIHADTTILSENVNGLAPENRIALDGKIDIGIGLWFESSIVHTDFEYLTRDFNRSLTVGLDYTFGLGNGLNMMTEVFTYSVSDKVFGKGDGVTFSAISASYPLSIITNMSAIVFYDWKNNDLYNFINCSWTFDRWTFYLMGFWNPERFRVYPGMEEANLFAGKGLQVMAVFNH
ncbi:MAG: hypothetical protein JSV24_00390 [Bacteroidales bacterium]|nr:MAG: hypothetical protein JSV24_00390 [Bacteroidales bacterium]